MVGTPISSSSPSATPTQLGRFVAASVQRRGSVGDGVQPNFQARNGNAGSACATSVTCEPAGNTAVQVGGQEIPAGSLTMVPVPLPPLITRTSRGVKRATSELASRLSRTEQAPVAAHPCALQPRKVLPGAAVAVAVTVVPGR